MTTFHFAKDYKPKVKEGAWTPKAAFDKYLRQLLEAGKFTKDEIKAVTMAEGGRIGKSWWSPKMVDRFLNVAIEDMKKAGLKPVVRA